jgi:hypothetical protein
MSFENSPFYIFPQVEATYDLNLSAAFLRASCVSQREPFSMEMARRFHQSLARDKAENWRDGISLAELMSDRALKAPSTQKVLRHVAVTPTVAMTSSFVANREGIWNVTMRMAQLARRSAPDNAAYEALMSGFREKSSDVWSVLVDTKMKVYREELGEFREYSKPTKDGTVPHVDPDSEIHAETKNALVPAQACFPASQLSLERLGEDRALLQRLMPLSYSAEGGESTVHENLRQLLSWRHQIAPQHFSALLDSYLRLVSFSEVLRVVNCTHELALTLRDAAQGRAVDISMLFVKNRYDVETGDNLKTYVDRPSLAYARDAFLLESFGDAVKELGFQYDLQSIQGIDNLISALRKNAKILGVFVGCVKDLESKENSTFSNDKKRNFEFLNYVIRQRQIKGDSDGQFDQGYWAKKKTRANNAPGVITVSPVGAALFAGLASGARPGCTFRELSARLRQHGVVVTQGYQKDLFLTLKSLGLANDNPDGDGGFLVRNPFYQLS